MGCLAGEGDACGIGSHIIVGNQVNCTRALRGRGIERTRVPRGTTGNYKRKEIGAGSTAVTILRGYRGDTVVNSVGKPESPASMA